MPEPSFRGFLDRSLRVLAREHEASYAAMTRALGSREIAFDVDGDRFTLAGARINDIRECDVELVTTRTTILDLVDARVDLLDACLQDRLVLRAMPTDLLAFHDALLAYLHGAVRSPSFPSLLREYRSKESP